MFKQIEGVAAVAAAPCWRKHSSVRRAWAAAVASLGLLLSGCMHTSTSGRVIETDQFFQQAQAQFEDSGCGNRNATLSTRDATVYTVTICGFTAASSTMNFAATPSVSWVSASPPFGTLGANSRGTVAVLASPRALTPGTYNESVTITAPGYQDFRITFITT